MTLDYGIIGSNIRLQRYRKGLKQAELADMVDVTSQHICHIEMNKSNPSLPILTAIANALDTDMNYLLGSNLTHLPTATLSAELAGILAGATKEQLSLCIRLCRAVMDATETKYSLARALDDTR